MELKIYLFIVFTILFICHFIRKEIEIRKYQELLNNEDRFTFIEERAFTIVDKYEISNIKKFSPPSYYLKLKSERKKEDYEEELKVSMSVFNKAKIGEKRNYKIYSIYGSNEVFLIDSKTKKNFFFDELKVFIYCEYVCLAAIACMIVYFLFIELFVQ